MRRLIEPVRDALGQFVEQRDDLVLCVRVSDDDAPIVLKLLRDLEQSQGSDIYLLFGDDFTDAAAFVTALASQLREQHALVSRALEEAGRTPLASPPALDDGTPPEECLRACVAYARSLLPDSGAHRLVWAMIPQRVSDRRAWLGLVCSLAPHRGIEPWMRRVRVIFRDTGDAHGASAMTPRARVIHADFGPAALERAVHADVEDPSLPLESRVQALVTEASLDHAHGRVTHALAKFRHALGHYQHTRNLTMQAAVMHCLGEVCRLAAMPEEALEWYECAAETAAASATPVVLAVVVRSLAHVALERERYDEAERYFDGLDALAGRLLDPENKAYALEWKGVAQHTQGRALDAIATWESAASLCRNVGMPSPLRPLLERLKVAYRGAGMPDRERAAERELVALLLEEHVHG